MNRNTDSNGPVAGGHGLGDGDGHAPRRTVHETRSSYHGDRSRESRSRRNDLHRLDVYRYALDLYRGVGRIVAQFPRGKADLRSQLKRAARSVVSFNIGEGVAKRGKARAAAYQIELGEAKELIVALDCVEINQLAPLVRRSAHARSGPMDWREP